MQREYKRQGFFRFIPASGGERELRCLKPGEGGINTICRVLDASARELTLRDGRQIEVIEGVIADYTAKIPFFSWLADREKLLPHHDQDRVIRIENAYVRRRNGLVTLYIGRGTKLVDTEILFPGYEELNKPHKRRIKDIIMCHGAFDVIVEGDILLRAGTRTGTDRSTGTVEEMMIDDGTGALFLFFQVDNKRHTNISDAEARRLSFGTPVIVRGNVIMRDGRYVLMAEGIRRKDNNDLMEGLMEFMARYTCIWIGIG